MKTVLTVAAVLAIAATVALAYFVGVIVQAAGNTLEIIQGAL